MSRTRTIARLASTLLLVLSAALPAAAVDPNLRLYLDEFPLQTPLATVIFAQDGGGGPLSDITAEGYADGAALEAGTTWDFSLLSGSERAIEFAPVDPLWSCYVPGGCGGLFGPAVSDGLFIQNDEAGPNRDVYAIDFNGSNTYFLKGQAIAEDTANELRICLQQDVPFLVFANTAGTRRYMAPGDAPWSSALFNCVQAVTQGGLCGGAGTDAYIGDGNGTAGRFTGRVAGAGTLTLPSGHVLDAVLTETYASFEAYGARLFGTCQVPAQRLRSYILMWMVPYYGPMVLVTSGADVADLASFTDAGATSIGYGLLPPLSITATAIGPDSISVSWAPGTLGANAPDSYDVHWGTVPGSQTPPPFSANTTATSYTISGLAVDTQYCVSVSSVKTYADPVAGPHTFRSIQLPASIGADIDGDGMRDTSYPPEICVRTGQPLPGVDLLRDHLTEIAPPTPAIATVLPLAAPGDLYVPSFVSGSLEPDATVLADQGRKLVFYAYDAAAPVIKVVKQVPPASPPRIVIW